MFVVNVLIQLLLSVEAVRVDEQLNGLQSCVNIIVMHCILCVSQMNPSLLHSLAGVIA